MPFLAALYLWRLTVVGFLFRTFAEILTWKHNNIAADIIKYGHAVPCCALGVSSLLAD